MYRVPRTLTLHWNIRGAGSIKTSFAGLYWWPVRTHAILRSYWQKREVVTSGHGSQDTDLCVLSQRKERDWAKAGRVKEDFCVTEKQRGSMG